MGEQNETIRLGGTFLFCRKEDIGTEKEQWKQVKADKINILLPEEAKKPSTEGPGCFSNNFSFTVSAESAPALTNFWKSSWKRERGNRYYRKKLQQHVSRKESRKYRYYIKKAIENFLNCQ